MSQKDRILNHLKKRPITGLQAMRLYGCMRLAARIYELRSAGHDIEGRWIKRAGKQYAQYKLVA